MRTHHNNRIKCGVEPNAEGETEEKNLSDWLMVYYVKIVLYTAFTNTHIDMLVIIMLRPKVNDADDDDNDDGNNC